MEEMKDRIKAMLWWNNLSSASKTRLCDTNILVLGGRTRRWETLTGREIEMLHKTIN